MLLLAVVGALVAGLIVAAIVLRLTVPDLSKAALLASPMLALGSNAAIELPPAIVLLAGMRWTSGASLAYLGFRRLDLRSAAVALAGVVGAILAANVGGALVQATTHQAPHDQEVVRMFLAIKSPWQIAAFAFFAAVLAPAVEELAFRIFLFNAGMRHWGFAAGATISSILFGLAHFDLSNALPLAMVGFVLCLVYYYSRNAYASMIAHGCFNLTTLLALHFFPQMAGT